MLMLVDAPGLWFRSFHALPSSLTAPDNTPINAVRGFLDGLATLIRNHKPTRLACAVDTDWRPQWRVDLLPSYKAHRLAPDGTEDTPEALPTQVDIIHQLMTAWGIPMIGANRYEADDVLATLAAHNHDETAVVTGDRDLFQVVNDHHHTKVIYIGRGIAKAETYDAAAVATRFGVTPAQYVDFAVLRGDPSDGLPGVKGIGDKTAASLLNQHHDLHGIRRVAHNRDSTMNTRTRNAINDSSHYLDVAPEVVTTVTNVNLGHTPDLTLPHTVADTNALASLHDRFGVSSAATRLIRALEQAGPA